MEEMKYTRIRCTYIQNCLRRYNSRCLPVVDYRHRSWPCIQTACISHIISIPTQRQMNRYRQYRLGIHQQLAEHPAIVSNLLTKTNSIQGRKYLKSKDNHYHTTKVIQYFGEYFIIRTHTLFTLKGEKSSRWIVTCRNQDDPECLFSPLHRLPYGVWSNLYFLIGSHSSTQ